MGGRVGWFIQVDEAVTDVVFDGSAQRCAASLQRSVVACADHQTMVVLRTERSETDQELPLLLHLASRLCDGEQLYDMMQQTLHFLLFFLFFGGGFLYITLYTWCPEGSTETNQINISWSTFSSRGHWEASRGGVTDCGLMTKS